jgi:hypothetical protein
MPDEQPPENQKGPERRPGPGEQPPLTDPSEIMSPESFAKWMSFAVSSLTPERLALLREMSEDLAKDPPLLKRIERMLADYNDEIRQISPSQSELERFDFGWTRTDQAPELVPPAAAAAALAPPAAALAAAHTPSD